MSTTDEEFEMPNRGDDRPGLDDLDDLVTGEELDADEDLDEDDDDDYPEDATEDDIDLVIACYREDGQPVATALELDLANDLDALIERHGLVCTARHRALGDTEALYQFAGLIAGQFGRDVLDPAIVKAMRAPSRPAGLPEGVLEGVPEGPGVYLFYGENALPIYIGKSVSLRSRVMSHFSSDHRSGKEAKLTQQVRRVEWLPTAGELGALLLEARLV